MPLTRICVEKTLNAHKDYLNSIKNNNRLQAAFFKSKLWPNGSTITIGFLDEPSNANHRTTIEEMKKVGRRIDPLQKSLANANLKDAVKTIVKQRIQPLFNLDFVFVEKVGGSEAHAADIRISFARTDQSSAR